jgi:DNA-binding transcriptional regulator YiaG
MRLEPSNLSDDTTYIAGLIEKTGLKVYEVADAIGMSRRAMNEWTQGKKKWKYAHQYALECLVKYGVKAK